MHWYSVSAWEHQTCKHVQENLPIYPDNPAFFQQFVEDEAIPSTSKFTPELINVEVICKRAEAAKQFLEEEGGQSTFLCPSTEEFEPSPLEAPKCCIKQGPVKSSKNEKEVSEYKAKDYDE